MKKIVLLVWLVAIMALCTACFQAIPLIDVDKAEEEVPVVAETEEPEEVKAPPVQEEPAPEAPVEEAPAVEEDVTPSKSPTEDKDDDDSDDADVDEDDSDDIDDTNDTDDVDDESDVDDVDDEDDADDVDDMDDDDYVVVIDPGHQRTGNYDKEPLGPGSSEMKMKTSSGTASPFTGIPEYELTLDVSLLLELELESRGYTVIMTRYDHDVDMGNIDRADVANNNDADVYIRIHANGSEDSSVSGAMALCPTVNSPYCPQIYDDSYRLSQCVLDAYTAATGMNKQYIWETDTMCGLNWSLVPVTILEMGYMTNQSDDTNMADPAFQAIMVRGMADGIDAFLNP